MDAKTGRNSLPELRTPWRWAARCIWIMLAPLNGILGILSMPQYWRQVESLANPFPLSGWNAPALAAALAGLGLTPRFLAIFLSLRVVYASIFFATGLLIFWRKSGTLLGLFVSYTFVSLAGTQVGNGMMLTNQLAPVWRTIVALAGTLTWPSFFIFLLIFPNGRFVPRWTNFLLIFWLGMAYLETALDLATAQYPPFFDLLSYLAISLTLAAQVYRYRHVSGIVERQQTRWFLTALCVVIFEAFLSILVRQAFPALTQPGPTKLAADLWISVLNQCTPVLLPLSVAVALFRYRLWDIDLLIRRTLLYGALTTLLALVYFGVVTLIQGLFLALTGQVASTAATVFSTLLVAALFTPLRQILQRGIDRRFYRVKYNAQVALESFTSAARDEVEVERLAGYLLETVDTTVQPDQSSLWIRRPRSIDGGRMTVR